MDNNTIRDRIRGSLIGGAIGDALGYPVEFIYSFGDIQRRYGRNGITRLDTHQWWLEEDNGNGKAVVSDDTQMTLFTACGLLNAKAENDPFLPSICEAYIEWLFTQMGKKTKGYDKCWIRNVPELNVRRAPGNTCITSLNDILRGVDPINIAAHIYLAIQEITTREIEATEPVVMTIGKFVGGKTPNVIPEDVVMEGTIRALSENAGRTAFERMKEISENIARAFRGSATVEELASAPPLTNDKELSDELSGYAKELFGDEEKVLGIKGGGMGSEDFAAIASKVPSVYFILGAGTKEENPNYGYPMHHQCVQFNEDILVKGAAMLSYASIKWLKDNSTNYKIDYTINEI